MPLFLAQLFFVLRGENKKKIRIHNMYEEKRVIHRVEENTRLVDLK